MRYRRYDGDLLLFELVNASRSSTSSTLLTNQSAPTFSSNGEKNREKTEYTGFSELLAVCSPELHNLWQSIDDYLRGLGDEVQVYQRKYYVAYRRLKNFAAVEVHPRAGFHAIFIKVDPSGVALVPDFTRDVSNIGHYGTGDLEIRIRNLEDLEIAKPLIAQSYQEN